MVFTKEWHQKQKEKKQAEKEAAAQPATTPVVKKEPLKAFYVEKDKGIWKLVIAEIDGDMIVSRKIKECMNKAHSLEEFKISFGKLYYFGK